MNKRMENWIYQLRIRGLGYKSIAMALDITPEKVRYYCKTHGLDGNGEDIRELRLYEMYKENPTECKNCGGVLIRNRYSGKKYFCSNKCRQQWKMRLIMVVIRSLFISVIIAGKSLHPMENLQRIAGSIAAGSVILMVGLERAMLKKKWCYNLENGHFDVSNDKNWRQHNVQLFWRLSLI